MAVSVLVMTPVRSFGQFIQQALDDTDLYSVTLVHDKAILMDQVRKGVSPVVVLDLDLEPEPAGLVKSLNSIDPISRIIAMKDISNGGEFDLTGLKLAKFIDGVFGFPVFLDVLNAVTSDLKGQAISPSLVENKTTSFPSQITKGKKVISQLQAPEWLGDVERAAQYLTRLSLKSAAQAALITRKDELWAYAGHLARPAADELALSVWRYWDRDGGSDLARFIRLNANDGEYMLYATGLGGDYVLALAFETETPFSEIRTEAGDLARRLKSPPMEIPLAESRAMPPQKVPAKNRMNNIKKVNHQASSNPVMENDAGFTAFPNNSDPDEVLANNRQAFFEDLLSAVEIPDPDGAPSPPSDRLNPDSDFIQDIAPEKIENITPLTVGDKENSSQHESLLKGTRINENNIPMDNNLPGDLINVSIGIQSGNDADRVDETISSNSSPEDNIQESQAAPMILEEFDPITPGFYNLIYACILVPRMLKHRLVGDLGTFLKYWVGQLAVASGWRLEHLEIHPEYLHWVGALSPDDPPGQMVADLRKCSSMEIFREYSRLARENPSGDFWAPGFLIVNGRGPLPQSIVDAYIEKTRSQQGITKS